MSYANLASDLGLSDAEAEADRLERIHVDIISRPDSFRQQSGCLIRMSRAYTLRSMPAKELSEEQLADAARLKAAFRRWQADRRARGEPSTQDEVAEHLFGFGQSALSQYLNGTIPLNAAALLKFARVLGENAETISPTIVKDARDQAAQLLDLGAEPPPDTQNPDPKQQATGSLWNRKKSGGEIERQTLRPPSTRHKQGKAHEATSSKRPSGRRKRSDGA